MYGEQHLLTYRSGEASKFLYALSFGQTVWWLIGGVVSYKLATYFPPIPGVGLYGYIPYLFPLAVCVTFAHVNHPTTGLSLGKYLKSKMKFHRRKKVFYQ